MTFSIYSEPDNNNLYQGDLIKCSAELYEIICNISNVCHGLKPEYLSILTQSCDLRRYHKKWKSETITIAFAYLFKQHANKLIDSFVTGDFDRKLLSDKVINDGHESKIFNDLIDVIKYKSHEFFLYHSDISRSINEDYYINLRISIPLLVSTMHELLLRYKVAQLKENFRDKLGYNISYLFSRVGVDEPDDEFVKNLKSASLSGYKIVSKANTSEIEKNKHHREEFNKLSSADDRLSYINDIHVPSQREILEKVLQKLISDKHCMPSNECNLLVKSYINDSQVRSILKK